MKKTENISLSGYAFTIEEDAYIELDNYMKDIRSGFAGNSSADEITADIEERIAELLSERCASGTVVSMPMIQDIKERIGNPEELAEEETDNDSEGAEKVQEVKEALTVKNGRVPGIEEIAEATGFTHEQIMQAMESAKAYGTYSLESAATDDDSEAAALEKYIGFEDSGYERIELGEIINNVLSGFSDTYRYIFKQRFIEGKSQAEIAQKLGVSQMTVSRSEKAIVENFRKELNRH